MFMRPIGFISFEQESIPVGCVPSAAVAICWGWGGWVEGCLPRGVSAPTGYFELLSRWSFPWDNDPKLYIKQVGVKGSRLAGV